MRCRFILDEKTQALLDELAAPRGNNRSFVVREALRVYASMEAQLDEVEGEPGFRRMMQLSEADIREGRRHGHPEARRIVSRKRR
jgi:predicted transcriptional regulator